MEKVDLTKKSQYTVITKEWGLYYEPERKYRRKNQSITYLTEYDAEAAQRKDEPVHRISLPDGTGHVIYSNRHTGKHSRSSRRKSYQLFRRGTGKGYFRSCCTQFCPSGSTGRASDHPAYFKPRCFFLRFSSKNFYPASTCQHSRRKSGNVYA